MQPCRLEGDAPRLALGRPALPDHLDQVGRDAWARLVESLELMRVLTPADGEALAIYATVYSRWRSALEAIDRHGPTVDTTVIRFGDGSEIPNPKGCVKSNPALAVAAACESTMARILASLGLTPADRSRVKSLDAGATSKLAKFRKA